MTRHVLYWLTISMIVGTVACGNNDDNNPPIKRPPVIPDMTKMDMSDMTDMDPDSDTDMPFGENAISVSDQTLTSDIKVTIDSVNSDGPGWVVIHEDDNGAPGAVIGQAKVDGGPTSNVEVQLTRAAVDKETLHAMLHADAPADGNYTFDGQNGEDPPATDKNNEVVVKSFVVTVDNSNIVPAVDVEDQTLDEPNILTVKTAVSNGPGWIVIHEDNNGDIGGVVGQTLLTQGSNLNIKVTINRPVAASERFYAMLHADAPADGNYTFDGQNGEDGPVLDMNNMVIAPSFIATPKSSGFDPVVEVEDQTTTTPTELVIKRVVSDGPGWVVIHEDDNGNIGAPIGRGFVGNGETMLVDVTLNRAALDQEKLYAMLHKDDPADGRYTFTSANGEDAPVLDMNNAPIAPPFTVTVQEVLEPAIDVPPVIDITTPRDITITSATSDGPGWVVVYEKDVNGNLGNVIGTKAVPDGTTMDIAVALTRDAVNGETIAVQLHKDDPADNNFTNATNPAEDVQAQDAQGLPVGGETVLILPQASLSVFAQNISDLSTVVTVDSVDALVDGWVIVQESDINGDPTNIIGQAFVSAGATLDLKITVNRPLIDAEIIHVTLREDAPADNIFDANADPVVTDGQGIEITQVFSPLLDLGVPAVRLTVTNMGASSYRITQVEPIEFIGTVSALNSDNPTINLRAGWRYEFVNNGFPGHPLEFITAGATRANDTVLLSQDGNVTGSLESDMNIDWSTDMNAVKFTVPAMNSVIDGYRCSISGHVNMRGTINTIP